MNLTDQAQYLLWEGAYELMSEDNSAWVKAPLFARVSNFLRHDRTLRFIAGYVFDVLITILLMLSWPKVMKSNPLILIWAGMISAIFFGIIIQIFDYFDSGRLEMWRIRWFMAGSLPVVLLRSILILVLWI